MCYLLQFMGGGGGGGGGELVFNVLSTMMIILGWNLMSDMKVVRIL